MELWLLAAGGIVLVAIAVWIVWPAHVAESVGDSVRGEEVSPTAMTDTPPFPTTPLGDRFEDQYTSATADLSAGGVAAAFRADTPAGSPPRSVPTQDPV